MDELKAEQMNKLSNVYLSMHFKIEKKQIAISSKMNDVVLGFQKGI